MENLHDEVQNVAKDVEWIREEQNRKSSDLKNQPRKRGKTY